MPLFSQEEIQLAAGDLHLSPAFQRELRRLEREEKAMRTKRYDVFLSHSYLDRDTVWRLVYLVQERLGLSVYVDWMENPELSRDNISPAVAAVIRSAMRRSRMLVYAFSTHSRASKWMQWELGYSDGLHSRVALLPLTDVMNEEDDFQGQEFLGLYPYISLEAERMGFPDVWLRAPNADPRMIPLTQWIAGATFAGTL